MPVKIEVREIPVSAIFVDRTVQRKFDQKWADRLFATWDESKSGVITVSARDDGTFHCAAGQHRLSVYRRQGRETVFALVIVGLDHQGEAEAFLGQSDTKTVYPIDKFVISVEAQREPETSILKLLRAHGWDVNPHTTGSGQFKALARARTLAVATGGMDALDSTLYAVTQAWGHQYEAVHANIISGVGRVFHKRDADRDRMAKVLRGTIPEQFRASATVIQQGSNPAVSASVAHAEQAVRLYNNGLRANRIQVFI